MAELVREQLLAKAAKLGMEVDGRWSDATLSEQINVFIANHDDSAVPEGTMRVFLKCGYFPFDGGEKIQKGRAVDLPEEEAKRLLKLDKAKRIEDMALDEVDPQYAV